MLLSCPDCHGKLHEGQHRFADGLFLVQYCKKCGFRKEVQEGQGPSAQKGMHKGGAFGTPEGKLSL